MATDKKITELTELTTPALEDVLAIVDDPSGTPVTKKSTLSNLRQEVLLHDETLGAASKFDVANISQDFDDLLLILSLRGDVSATGDIGYINFNNDATAANYHRQSFSSFNGTNTTAAESAAPYITDFPGATAPANSFGDTVIQIKEYTNANRLKMASGEFELLKSAGLIVTCWHAVSWEDGGATAINRIAITTDNDPTDQFAANSRLRIIGIKYGA